MSVRRKAFLVLLSFWASLFLGVAIFDSRFFWISPFLMFGLMIYSITLRCPNCGQSIYKRRKKLWGMEAIYYGGNPVPRRCSRCGQDLSQTRKGDSSVSKFNAV